VICWFGDVIAGFNPCSILNTRSEQAILYRSCYTILRTLSFGKGFMKFTVNQLTLLFLFVVVYQIPSYFWSVLPRSLVYLCSNSLTIVTCLFSQVIRFLRIFLTLFVTSSPRSFEISEKSRFNRRE